jgi:hypothetical protein
LPKKIKIILNILFVVFVCFVILPSIISGQNNKSSKVTPILPLLLDSEENSCIDSDNDTYFAREGCGTPVDCNDSDTSINPGMSENCSDGIDNDCDQLTDAADLDCSLCTDSNEQNETCSAATPISSVAELDEAQIYTLTIYPQNDADYLRVYAEEGSHVCVPFSSQNYSLQITLTPPGADECPDYDLYVYGDNCSEVMHSTSSGCTPESLTVTWEGSCVTDDSLYLRLKVVGINGDYSCEPYTLTIDMWQD